MRRLPGPAYDRPGDGGDSRGSLRIVSGLAENTNSIFCDGSPEPEAANECPVLHGKQDQSPRGKRAQQSILIRSATRSPEREENTRAFSLTKTYMNAGHSTKTKMTRSWVQTICNRGEPSKEGAMSDSACL
jgi:hypothetical protein